MIESCYWKEDLLRSSKKFKPVSKPPRWSEKLQVNFEKEVIISFFMIRKLMESNKLSKSTISYKAQVFRSLCINKVNNRNFWDIMELYELESEQVVSKSIGFICNQLIHGGAIYAYREKDRNWGGIYTCSDFEREKFIYKIPINEIIKILDMAGNDYPGRITMIFSESIDDYVVNTE
ncbi:hypothetical protein [Vreelandella titanicae]|uniref:hypothetical protein n=1 Tax=Vreelandella titanicae TaxID=664683 RepID=UPI0011440207|nr:hypothetical protein [Halomonas titanicae]